jgi:TolB protein
MLLGFTGPTAAGEAVQAANGRIVFTSDRDGNAELYLLKGAGSDQTRLTNNAVAEAGPVWNVDRIIAFVRTRGSAAEVFAGSPFAQAMRITSRGAHESDPAWSPAGGKLAFSSDRDGNSEIYVVAFGAYGAVNLTNEPSAADTQPAWSSSGQVAFVSDRSGRHDIWLMDANGSLPTNLTQSEEAEADLDWSPDATEIAFTRWTDGQADVWVMNADGTNARPLTRDPANDLEPSWSPDGEMIVFASDREQDFEVYVMRARDGRGQTNISNSHPGNDRSPDWEALPPPGAGPAQGSPDTTPPENRPCTTQGTDKGERIRGKAYAETLCGRGGHDRIWGGRGSDTIRGGSGPDALYARDGVGDKIYGGPGRDCAVVDTIDDVFQVEDVRYPGEQRRSACR